MNRFSSKLFLILNSTILFFCLIFISIYVLWANGSTAASYKIGLLNDELVKVTEENSRLALQKSEAQDIDALKAFAERNGMVQSSNFGYIFENTRSALNR